MKDGCFNEQGDYAISGIPGIGLAASPEEASLTLQGVPKMAIASPPQSCLTTNKEMIDGSVIDFTARIMGRLHRTNAVTGAISTVGAAMIPGTVVHDVIGADITDNPVIRLGHPSGVIEIGAVMEKSGDGFIYREAVLGRTARRLMEGYVRMPKW